MARQLSREYYEYMRSPAWARKRKAYFASPRTPKGCQGCGKRGRLDLHHNTYVRFTHERLSDLVPVCRACHQEIHRGFDSRTGNLPERTRLILGRLRRKNQLRALEADAHRQAGGKRKALTKAQARAALNSPRSAQLHPAVRAALARKATARRAS